MSTATTTKQKPLVPELRFSDFSGEWERHPLSELVDNVGGTALESHTDKQGTHKFISIGNYSTTGIYIDNGQRVVLNDKTKTKLLDKNNLAMVLNDKTASGDIIGSTILIDEDDSYIYNQRTERLVCKENFLPKYAWLYLNSPRFRKRIVKISQGGTQIYVNFPSVKRELVLIPKSNEQQKIADFLGSVDAWLDNLRGQKTALQSYKQGMMQKLFTGQVRFKDEAGKSFPDWEEKQLGEICKIRTGKKDVNQGNPDGKYPFFTCAKKHTYSDEYSFDCEAILIAGNGEVGHSLRYSGKFEAYQRTYVLSDFMIRYDYVWTVINTLFEDYVTNQTQMGAMPYIKLGTLQTFVVPTPVEAEQQKIADFLTALDQTITTKADEITKVEEWKKGLMQKMFV